MEKEMKPEDLKLLIEKNRMLQYALRVMNDLPIDDSKDPEKVDYIKLWENVSLNKKIDPGEVSPSAVAFYFDLLSTGYDNFGADFFRKMAESENAPYLYYAIKCFIEYMSDYTEEKIKENDTKEKDNA